MNKNECNKKKERKQSPVYLPIYRYKDLYKRVITNNQYIDTSICAFNIEQK